MNIYPKHLQDLIELLRHFPGVGQRSAERYAFDLLQWPEERLTQLTSLLAELPQKLLPCQECGCLTQELQCLFCESPSRTPSLLCIISSPKDAFAIEETHQYKGLYHVIGPPLSPIEGRGPESLNLPGLFERIQRHGIDEIILALDSTLEGDATSLYLQKALKSLPVCVSRLAMGMPLGSSLDYVDGSTLARAFSARQTV